MTEDEMRNEIVMMKSAIANLQKENEILETKVINLVTKNGDELDWIIAKLKFVAKAVTALTESVVKQQGVVQSFEQQGGNKESAGVV